MPVSRCRCCLVLFLVAISASLFAADEWPQFRGPAGTGHADAKRLVTQWSETDKITWKTELPGRGWSSPVISDRYIWMTTAIETAASEADKAKKTEGRPDARQLVLASHISLRGLCVDRDSGKLLHNVVLFELNDPDPIHNLNSYASPTPVIVGERVFCHFGTYGTACLHLETGEVIWKTQQFKYDPQNGPGASPAAWKDLLIFHCDGRDVQYAVAIKQESGEVAWKTRRSGKMHENINMKKAYCTPTIMEGERPQLISPAADWVYSLDPTTGKELWKANYGQLGFSTVSKPIIDNGIAYVLTGFGKSRLLAVGTDGSGDVSDTHVKWFVDRSMPSKPSLLLVDDKFYCINDKGIASCLDQKSGDVLWTKRIGGAFSASPLYAAGHIYLFDQEGETTILKSGDSYQHVASNQLDGRCMASPAVVGSALYLRSDKAIYRIE